MVVGMSLIHTFIFSQNPLIPDLKVFENQLKGFDTENSKLTKQIKRFLFSRNINEDEDCKTVFERILSKPGAAAVIQLIWEKCNLDNYSEILNLVSSSKHIYSSFGQRKRPLSGSMRIPSNAFTLF